MYLFGFHVPIVQVPHRRDHLHRILGLVQQSVEASKERKVRPAVGGEGQLLWDSLHKLHSEKSPREICWFPELMPFRGRYALPAVPATVLLCDVVLDVPPDVDGRENQGNHHGQAEQEGEVGDALLLALGDPTRSHPSRSNGRKEKKQVDARRAGRASAARASGQAPEQSTWPPGP